MGFSDYTQHLLAPRDRPCYTIRISTFTATPCSMFCETLSQF